MPQSSWLLAALSACLTVVAGFGIPVSSSGGSQPPTQPDYSKLAEQLSSTASIYWPGSEQFNDITLRWSNLSVPIANIVVVPGTEDDVVKTVINPFAACTQVSENFVDNSF